MTIDEFKVWLDGYVEGAGKLPPLGKLMAKLDEVYDRGCNQFHYHWQWHISNIDVGIVNPPNSVFGQTMETGPGFNGFSIAPGN